MLIPLFDGPRLEVEYDRKYALRKLTDAEQGIILYGNTPAERLKTLNWLQWCEQAALCTRFCRLCGLPMDPIEDTHPDDRCSVCISMEGVFFHSTYWQNLP